MAELKKNCFARLGQQPNRADRSPAPPTASVAVVGTDSEESGAPPRPPVCGPMSKPPGLFKLAPRHSPPPSPPPLATLATAYRAANHRCPIVPRCSPCLLISPRPTGASPLAAVATGLLRPHRHHRRAQLAPLVWASPTTAGADARSSTSSTARKPPPSVLVVTDDSG